MVTNKELREAQTILFTWFVEQNKDETLTKPITMLDTEIELDGKKFRLITHMSFYGRNERPIIDLNDDKGEEHER